MCFCIRCNNVLARRHATVASNWILKISRLLYNQSLHQLAIPARIPFRTGAQFTNAQCVTIQMRLKFCFTVIPGYGIATNFCTYYDSTAAAPCGKLCNHRPKFFRPTGLSLSRYIRYVILSGWQCQYKFPHARCVQFGFGWRLDR